MSSLTVPGIGRFTQYFDSINQFGNDTQEDLTSASQVKNTHDPFGLRKRYASSRQDVIDTLDKIDAAFADFNPDEDKYLDLHGIDFTPLNGLQANRHEILNLDGLLRASQNILQYPLFRANLSKTILTGADLTRATLNRATLNRADLREVNLTKAILTKAILYGADLRRAFAFVNDERLTGNALKNYLVTLFNVEINGETEF